MIYHLRYWRIYFLFLITVALIGCSTQVRKASELPEMPTASDQTEPERRAQLRLDLAAAYFENGQIEVALDEIKIALGIYTGFAEAYDLRGLIYASISMNELAQQNFRKAIQLRPKNARFWHNQAWFYCQTNRSDDAIGSFETSLGLAKSTELAKTWLAYGICQARAKNWNHAESLLLKAYGREPSNILIKLNLAEVFYQLEKYNMALQFIEEIKHNLIDKDAPLLWLNWKVHKKIGNDVVAREIEAEILQKFPNSPERLLLNLGKF